LRRTINQELSEIQRIITMRFSKRIFSTAVVTLCLSGVFAQKHTDQKTEASPVKAELTLLDSIKASFVKNEKLAKIDKLWIQELTNEELSEDMFADIQSIAEAQEVEFELSTELLKERLRLLDEKSPFNIEYNPALENTIKLMLKNRRKSMGRLMALSEYYFPLFEEKLAKYKIPLELKYLAIVESALNPRAVSRMGASGLWQFMLPTGRMYNLNVDSYVDERYDPIKSTEAACQYLSMLHGMYDDWDLALAAYNAGPGNVNKAIRRSNGYKNYWNIRNFLPRETQGYVPAFVATMYLFEFHKEHNIAANRAPVKRVETDTIYLKRKMSFGQISDLVDVSIEELRFMNPSYKLDVIPYSSEKPNYVRLPFDRIGLFVANEDKIYAYIDIENSKKEQLLPFKEETVASSKGGKARFHLIRRGENLGSIAKKYGVSVTNLKKWNNIAGSNIQAGKKLKIM
jgi:membrane-bound lytic murein transglycosylase D